MIHIIASTGRSAPSSPILSVIGVSHETAPIEVREQLSLAGEKLSAALGEARVQVEECVILSTCNRFELYMLLPSHVRPDLLLPGIGALGAEQVEPYTYCHQGLAAARHLFRVAAGLDSLVLGEVQILGQVQRAWQAAHTSDAVGPVLSQLFHRAIALGKRVHSETTISRRPASISYAAVVLARHIFGQDMGARHVLVIGTGEVGEGVARCLHEHGLHATVVAHRHIDRARNMARRYQAEVATWDQLTAKLASADVVISSTAAPHTVLHRQHIEEAMQGRPERAMYLIDLAVPRDIDPAAATLPSVHLSNIDDLQAVVNSTMAERQTALPLVEAMVSGEIGEFDRWLRARSSSPGIRQLQEQADEALRRELQWAFAKLPELSPRERQIVEAMAARIKGKLLHQPIQWLKAQALENADLPYSMEDLDVRQMNDLFFADSDS